MALFISHDNLCRVHEMVRMTPAMGVVDHIWTIGELVEAATNPETAPPRRAPFTVIDGGRVQRCRRTKEEPVGDGGLNGGV